MQVAFLSCLKTPSCSDFFSFTVLLDLIHHHIVLFEYSDYNIALGWERKSFSDFIHNFTIARKIII